MLLPTKNTCWFIKMGNLFLKEKLSTSLKSKESWQSHKRKLISFLERPKIKDSKTLFLKLLRLDIVNRTAVLEVKILTPNFLNLWFHFVTRSRTSNSTQAMQAWKRSWLQKIILKNNFSIKKVKDFLWLSKRMEKQGSQLMAQPDWVRWLYWRL